MQRKRGEMNKKAISTIIITVIMVALVLVAIGVVWVVINRIITSSSENINWGEKCLSINIVPTTTSCTGTACTLTLKRTGSSKDVIAGVKVQYRKADGTLDATIDDIPQATLGAVATTSLSEKTLTGIVVDAFTANNPYTKVEVVLYFKDTAGNEKYCAATSLSF